MLANAARVTPPQPRRNWIVRQRAMESLYAALDCRLVLMVGGAGYGKTGLLAQFVASTDFTVAWLTIDSADEDLQTFGEAMVAAFGRCFPGFGSETLQLLRSGADLENNTLLLARTLARDLEQRITHPTCLVLDDFHLIEGSRAAHRFVDGIIAEMPDDCHVIISSRSVPQLQLGLLMADQQVKPIGQAALRLDAQETRNLIGSLRGVAPGTVADLDVDKTYKETDGWLVGVLITNQIEQLRDAQLGLGAVAATDVMNDYLLTRVLRQLPAPLQRFLLQSSVLETISPQFCEKELGWLDTRECIRETERRNLFVYRLAPTPDISMPGAPPSDALSSGDAPHGSGVSDIVSAPADVVYRYHPLFREFLIRRLREDESLSFAEIQRQVGLAYARNGAIDLAMRHLFQGGWKSEIAQVLEDHGATLLQQGHNRKLLTWARQLDALDPDIRRNRHILLQIELIASLNLGNDTTAMRAVDALDALFASQEDFARRDALGIYRGLLLCRSGQYKRALECGQSVINSNYAQQTLTRVEALRISAIALLELGALEQALSVLNEAEQLMHGLGRAGWRQLALIKHVKSFVLDSAGACPQALLAAVEATRLARELNDPAQLALVTSRLACLLLFDGQVDKALYTASTALEMAEGTANAVVRAESLSSLAMVSSAQGDLRKAIDMSSAALQIARQVGQQESGAQDSLFTLLLEHCRLLALLSQDDTHHPPAGQHAPLSDALALAREAAALAEETQSNRRRVQAYARIGALQALQGEPKLALATLQHAESLRAEINDNYVGVIHLWQAIATEMIDRRATAKVKRAYELVHTDATARGQTYFINAEGNRAIAAYQRRTGQTRQPVEFAQTWHPETVSRNHIPKPQITVVEHEFCIRAFGPGQIWRGKDLMNQSDWQWNIPREIFFYMLTFQQASRDQIGLDFWPDSSTTTLQNSFHSAKFAIRKALGKPGIIYKDGAYYINPDLDYIYDVDEFRRWIATADMSNPALALSHLTNATNLYRDDFLRDSGYDWAANIRRQLREQFMGCCVNLGKCALQLSPVDHNLVPALNAMEHALFLDPLREDIARLVISLNGRLGNRNAAITVYQRLGETLEKELGVAPEPATEAAFRAIMSG